MADSIIGQGCTDGIEASNVLVLEDGDSSKIDINCVEIPDLDVDKTEVEVGAPLTNPSVILNGDQDALLTGRKTTELFVSNQAPKGSTASLILQNGSNQSVTYETPGKGKTELIVSGGKFKQSSVTTAERKVSDYIEFGSNAVVTNSSISTNKGPDNIIFGGGLKLKKTTTVETGNGRDVVTIGETRTGKGKLLLSDFAKKDRLVVGGEGGQVLKLRDIQNGEAPNWVKLEA